MKNNKKVNYNISDDEWKIIPDTNNLFKINKSGRIIKLPHIIKYKDGRDKHIREEKEFEAKIDDRGYLSVNNSILRKIGGGRIHHLLAHTFIGKVPNKKVVDHIDDDKLNNSLDNLQIITIAENVRKSMIKKHKKIKGCYYRKNRKKWSAQIVIEGKIIRLGCFEQQEDATKAYEEALKKYNLL